MAIEIPNVVEAGGLFDGKAVPTFDSPVLSSNGILPYNAGTTPSVPKGGFTRIATGGAGTLVAYLIKLVQPIDGQEAVPSVTKTLAVADGPNSAIPAAIVSPNDGNILVGDSAHAAEEGIEFSFSLVVFRIQTGPNATPSE